MKLSLGGTVARMAETWASGGNAHATATRLFETDGGGPEKAAFAQKAVEDTDPLIQLMAARWLGPDTEKQVTRRVIRTSTLSRLPTELRATLFAMMPV